MILFVIYSGTWPKIATKLGYHCAASAVLKRETMMYGQEVSIVIEEQI